MAQKHIVSAEEDELEFVKMSILKKFENAFLEPLCLENQSNTYFNTCWRQDKDMTLEKLLNTMTKSYELISDLETVQSAVDADKWKANPDLFMKNIPRIQNTGVDYDLTFFEKAKSLGKVFSALPRGAMFMSATISCTEKSIEYKFEDFFTECGLPLTTPALQTNEVFDSRHLTIFVPRMRKYKYTADTTYKTEYEKERIAHLEHAITLNPKATLVVGNNLVDIQHVCDLLKTSLVDYSHIFYNTDQGAFDEFVKSKKNNAIVYGSGVSSPEWICRAESAWSRF